MESFWSRMQVELLNRKKWRTRLELANAMFEYIEVFHNRQRRHSSIGYLTPIQFETRTPVAQKSSDTDYVHPGACHTLRESQDGSQCRSSRSSTTATCATNDKTEPERRDALAVNRDFDRLGVGAMVAIGRVRYIAAAVADASGKHTGLLADQLLHAPEASACQDRGFGLCHVRLLNIVG